ncbi:MATE efflux family protein [Rhizodiscina lignyota]|uniref:MATE efflux family protein n=1 Tax=Rhizodiscina lignyota TaxID=1504668 RepID=A0A9P4M057_9PEZI|nr:MATE efflux family protein [Rhizodiscina lignyota]
MLPVTVTYRTEIWQLFIDTMPITVSFAFQNVMQAASILICGRLGTFELSVASFGYMFFSSTATMTAIGGSTAIDTLCSQAFNSASSARGDQRHYLGIVLQRGLIFLAVFFFAIIMPLWWHSGPLFHLLGQKEDFSSATESFLKALLPAGLCQVISECVKKFLQVQNHRAAVGWCIGIAAILGVVMNYILVLHTNLGVIGAAISHAIYHFTTVVTMVVYIAFNKSASQYWGGFTWKAFADPWPFIILALSGLLTVATEFWCFQSVALMAATLDTASIGAQSIVMTSDLIFATVPLGIGVSSSHKIGKTLGLGQGSKARFQIRIPYLLALIIGSVECVILLSARNVYGRAFSDDVDVVRTTAQVLPLLAIFQCLDISNGGAAGILRGAGKTHLSGGSNVVGYYGVGLVLAWALCFKAHLGLFGLWAGLITGSATLLLIQSGWVFSINWEREADSVLARAEERVKIGADERTPLLQD